MLKRIFGVGQRRKPLTALRVEMLPQNRNFVARPITAGCPGNRAGERAAQGLHCRKTIRIQVNVASETDPHRLTLAALGWSPFFAAQIAPEEAHLQPLRISNVHCARMSAQSAIGTLRLVLLQQISTADYAVGDWVIVEPGTAALVRRLDRSSLLQRRTEGARVPQLIAANVDTLFIATSCNDDLNPARLEHYLAMANEAGTHL